MVVDVDVTLTLRRQKRPAPVGDVDDVGFGRVWGVEVDGGVVRAVEVDRRRAVSFSTFEAGTASEALAKWRKASKVRGRVAVVWSGPGLTYRRLALGRRPSDDTVAAVVEHVASQEMGTTFERHVTAGVCLLPDGDSEVYGVVSVEVDLLAEVWKPLADLDDVSVSAAPLMWLPDGLHLSVGWSAATLSFVESGYPLHFRYLEPGGLEVLAAEIPSVSGFCGLRDVALERVLPAGPAGAAVAGYIERLVVSLRQTVASWRNQGVDVGDTVRISGPGERLAREELERAVGSQSGLLVRSDELPAVGNRSAIPVADEPACLIALTAALSPAPPEVGVLRDRSAEIRRRERSRVRRKRRTVLMAAGAAVAVVAAAVIPIVLADRTLSAAQRRAAAEQATYARVAPYVLAQERYVSGRALHAGVVSSEANLSAAVAAIAATAPSGTTFQTFSIAEGSAETRSSPSQVQMTVTAKAPGTNFGPISTWIADLRSLGLEASPTSFEAPAHGSGVSVAMTVTASLANVRRLAGQTPLRPAAAGRSAKSKGGR